MRNYLPAGFDSTKKALKGKAPMKKVSLFLLVFMILGSHGDRTELPLNNLTDITLRWHDRRDTRGRRRTSI